MPEYTWKQASLPQLREKEQVALCRVWLLAGEEEWFRQQFLGHILRLLLEDNERDWGLEVVRLSPALLRTQPAEGSWAKHILMSASALPFFSPKRVVVVEECQLLPADQQEELTFAFEALPESSILIFTSPDNIGAVSKSTATKSKGRGASKVCSAKFVKAVAKLGNIVQFAALNKEDALGWINRQARKAGKAFDPSAAALLVNERIGTDIGRLKKELDKLVLFAGADKTINTSHIEQMTPRLVEENIFDLTKSIAMGTGGKARALVLLRRMAQSKESPQRILPMIIQHFRLIWQAKGLLEAGWRPGQSPKDEAYERCLLSGKDSAARVFAGKRSFTAPRYAEQARRFNWNQLEDAMFALYECDLAMKGISSRARGDDWFALELTVISLCSDAAELPKSSVSA